jgi:hypothetical protein
MDMCTHAQNGFADRHKQTACTLFHRNRSDAIPPRNFFSCCTSPQIPLRALPLVLKYFEGPGAAAAYSLLNLFVYRLPHDMLPLPDDVINSFFHVFVASLTGDLDDEPATKVAAYLARLDDVAHLTNSWGLFKCRCELMI